MTVNPAEILGLDGRVGALAEGRDGDVVLWSGDPLSIDSQVRQVFIGGREVLRPSETGVDGVDVVERSERFA